MTGVIRKKHLFFRYNLTFFLCRANWNCFDLIRKEKKKKKDRSYRFFQTRLFLFQTAESTDVGTLTVSWQNVGGVVWKIDSLAQRQVLCRWSCWKEWKPIFQTTFWFIFTASLRENTNSLPFLTIRPPLCFLFYLFVFFSLCLTVRNALRLSLTLRWLVKNWYRTVKRDQIPLSSCEMWLALSISQPLWTSSNHRWL